MATRYVSVTVFPFPLGYTAFRAMQVDIVIDLPAFKLKMMICAYEYESDTLFVHYFPTENSARQIAGYFVQ